MTASHVRYDVTDAEGGESLEFAVPSSVTDDAGVERGTVSVTVARDTSYSLDVTSFTERPSGIGPVDSADDVPLYLDVTGDEAMNDSLDSVSVELTLSKAAIDAQGTTADNVAVYRYHDGSWDRLGSSVDEHEGAYLLQATAPGTSYFALGIRHPVASVSNVTAASDVTVGEQTTMTADVTNTGHADGTVTVSMRVDGEPVSNRSVSLAAGETKAVTFDHRYETAGAYTVELGTERVDVTVTDVNRVQLTDVAADATTIGPGENVTLIATLQNTGDVDAETTVRFGMANGETVTRTVTVPAGQREVVMVQQQLDSPGSYTLAVNDQPIDVTVKEGASKFAPGDSGRDEQGVTTSTPDDQSLPRYGLELVLVLAVAVIVVALIARLVVERDDDT